MLNIATHEQHSFFTLMESTYNRVDQLRCVDLCIDAFYQRCKTPLSEHLKLSPLHDCSSLWIFLELPFVFTTTMYFDFSRF